MTHEAGKGDTQRPTNWDHFSENFDRIFGKKPTKDQEANEALRRQVADAVNLASDPTGLKVRENP